MIADIARHCGDLLVVQLPSEGWHGRTGRLAVGRNAQCALEDHPQYRRGVLRIDRGRLGEIWDEIGNARPIRLVAGRAEILIDRAPAVSTLESAELSAAGFGPETSFIRPPSP